MISNLFVAIVSWDLSQLLYLSLLYFIILVLKNTFLLDTSDTIFFYLKTIFSCSVFRATMAWNKIH